MLDTINQGIFKFQVTDHHAILGIPLDATESEVRKRYMRIARILHPDTCKAATPEGKELASRILSLVVNPSYEYLYDKKGLGDQRSILNQLADRISRNKEKIVSDHPLVQRLQQAANKDVETVYKQLLDSIIDHQYKDLNNCLNYIAELSEINLVYLSKQDLNITIIQTQPNHLQPVHKVESKPTPESPSLSHYNRAEELMQKNLYAKAQIELKEALKLEPTNVKTHALLGIAYLKQNNIPYAKVHIGRALTLDPQNKIALDGKRELEKQGHKLVTTTAKTTPTKPTTPEPEKKSSGGGFFGGLFGGKK